MRVLSASLLVFVTSATGVLSACIQHPANAGKDATPPVPSARLGQPAQIIIKFRGDGPDPSQPHLLNDISRDAGVTLVYVRPMSGGAHVLRLENPSDGAALDRVIERLGGRRDVEYVEPDRSMRHMKGMMQ